MVSILKNDHQMSAVFQKSIVILQAKDNPKFDSYETWKIYLRYAQIHPA